MKIGLHIPTYTWEGGARAIRGRLAEIGEAAEAAGFDTITVVDHLWQHPIMGGREQPMLEAYATLAFLAAHTERVRLMALATAVPYRHAGLLAKEVTTLDVLSGGRAWLGIGAGDDEEEADGLGLPFGSTAERFDRMEETLRACLEMWDGERGSEGSLDGRYVHLKRALNLPQSLSRPHPGILVAGGGERRTLPLVARYANACNIPPTPELPRKLDRLRALCDEIGRDFGELEITVPFGFDVGPDGSKAGEVIGQLRWLAGMGVETVIGWVVGVERIAPLEVMGRTVLPAAAELEVAA
jgi:F420-dependent oxidoreductase-like protein